MPRRTTPARRRSTRRPAAGGGRSADEVARDLANPNSPLASLTFRAQFRWFEGDIPGADDESGVTLLFQPVFPFELGTTASGGQASLFVRPAIPIIFDQPTLGLLGDQPVLEPDESVFESASGLGDIVFDVAYGVTEQDGTLWAAGAIGTLPTATRSGLGAGKFAMGPNGLLARFEDWGIYGLQLAHQWDVVGWGDDSINVTSGQAFFVLLPGEGWTVGTTPRFAYDWSASEFTIPLNLAVSRTLQIGELPLKVGIEVEYYLARPDAFGPEWAVYLNVTPVVPNVVANWFR